MGQERWNITIVLGCFSWVGLLVGNIRRVDIVDLGEEYPVIAKILEPYPGVLVHFLEYADLCR